ALLGLQHGAVACRPRIAAGAAVTVCDEPPLRIWGRAWLLGLGEQRGHRPSLREEASSGCGKEDLDFAVRCLSERVQHVARRTDVAEEDSVLRELHIAETNDLVAEWATFLRRRRPVGQLRPATPGDDEACWVPCELQVLQIVVVPAYPEVHLVLPKQRVPVID